MLRLFVELIAEFRPAVVVSPVFARPARVALVFGNGKPWHAEKFSDGLSSFVVPWAQNAERLNEYVLAWNTDGLDYRFRLEAVRATSGDDEKTGYRLTTIAGKVSSEGESGDECLERAHNELQVLFRDLLSDRARNEWKLQESFDGT